MTGHVTELQFMVQTSCKKRAAELPKILLVQSVSSH
jgi:hypothetical protein